VLTVLYSDGSHLQSPVSLLPLPLSDDPESAPIITRDSEITLVEGSHITHQYTEHISHAAGTSHQVLRGVNIAVGART